MILSKDQCLNIKGYAMVLIILYNFLRHQIGIDGNEMYFSSSYTKDFIENIFTLQGAVYLVSFSGWIGVPLFLFLSGYGLSKKYGETEIDIFQYLKRHYVKLLTLLVPVFFVFLLVNSCVFHNGFSGRAIVTQILLIINVWNPNIINPGTYWFFGLIMQFYLLFLLLRKIQYKNICFICIVAIGIDYCLLYLFDESTVRYLKHNCIGWLVPFLIGIMFEKINFQINKMQNIEILLMSTVLFMLTLTIKFLSPLTTIFAIIIFVCITNLRTNNIIKYIGIISPSLFVIHPVSRMIINNTMDSKNMLFLSTLLYLLLTISGGVIHNNIISVY